MVPYRVKRNQDRTWDVCQGGDLIEGQYATKKEALRAAERCGKEERDHYGCARFLAWKLKPILLTAQGKFPRANALECLEEAKHMYLRKGRAV